MQAEDGVGRGRFAGHGEQIVSRRSISLDDDDVGGTEAEIEGAEETGGGEEVGGNRRRDSAPSVAMMHRRMRRAVPPAWTGKH